MGWCSGSAPDYLPVETQESGEVGDHFKLAQPNRVHQKLQFPFKKLGQGNLISAQVAYHMLVHRFVLFRQGDSSNVEYKTEGSESSWRFIDTCNGVILFGNSPGATEWEIKVLGIDPDISKDVQ